MVRVGDHILGPYETDTINSLIKSHKISEIDEVALPCKSWGFVRDRKDFQEALASLKSSSFSKPSSSGSGTNYTGTEDIGELTSSDDTMELTSSDKIDTKTAPIPDFKVPEGESPILDINRIKSFSQPKPVTSNNQKFRKFLFAFALVMFGVGGYLYSSETFDYNPLDLLTQNYDSKFQINWDDQC